MTPFASVSRRTPMACVWALLAGLIHPVASDAQHIQAPAQGVSVPPAYFQRIEEDPGAFTLPNGLFRADARGRPLPVEQLGEKRMVVVPALFSDSPDPHVSSEEIQRTLFDGPAARGTLTEVYDEMSRGLFHVTGDVSPWVRTEITRAEVVGADAGLGEDARLVEYLLQALALADDDIDFGAYDDDGPDGVPNSGDDDGFVDAIAFEFLEVAASCGGPGIWPHRWGIAPQNDGEPYSTNDPRPDGTPVRVNAYIIQSAVDCGGAEPQDAGVIAHEFGHVLGLSDYYHATGGGGAAGRRWVLGCWELMAAGAWGCGPHGSGRGPFGPTHFSARSKETLGWLEYVTLPAVRDTTVALDPVQASGRALRISLDDTGREFLLVEFRDRTGFDRDLPAEGVLIYHQDFQGFYWPTGEQPYFVSLLEQDDNNGLIRNSFEGGNRGEASDAWGVAGSDRKLNAATAPNTRRNDGTPSSVAFHSITVKDGKAHLRLSTARTPEIVAPAEPLVATQVTTFEKRLRIAGGYMPYTASGTVPSGLSLSAQGDELVVTGSLTEPGPFELRLRVTDARGAPSRELTLPLTAGEWGAEEDRLLQSFLRSSGDGLTPGELSYLDYLGNRNGTYDVGDLRAWLRSRAKLGS